MAKVFATLTSKGQLTLPRALREAWMLKAGDQVGFEITGPAEGRIVPLRRRSILEGLDALTVRIDRPLTQAAIDAAIDDDLADEFMQSGSPR